MHQVNSSAYLEKIKSQIIDATLIAGVFAGLLALLLAYFPYGSAQQNLNFYTDSFAVFILVLVCAYRKSIRIKMKAYIVIIMLISLVLSDIYSYGLYALNKSLLIIIPFYALFSFNFWKALFFYFISITAFLCFGYFEWYHIQEEVLIITRMNSFVVWLEGAVLLSTVSLIVLIFTKKYNSALSGLISNLEQNNNELIESQAELTAKNESLEETLDKLKVNNEKLAEYAYINSHILRAPLARLLGISNLVSSEIKLDQHKEIMASFKASAEELDQVVAKINAVLEEQNELNRNNILDPPKKTTK
ncbi:hypothetical protein N7E81_05220 [Reichenbachiella carrageenanivorans]|uniref:Signal transduction histidine kinase dimerisation/phosphoacceptor domain-containing protein n=1 Tax=Reichenbachiella carrageenanivorans TaxID=2979869 RepID=A0ABY6D2Z8_9BACT|nr:hypothetical protein [Reichenbachiella carrageenanivorans]UXX80498.1 hypothetical protein N7E81_05220 [Reichenbachiella carrageenanivorans]